MQRTPEIEQSNKQCILRLNQEILNLRSIVNLQNAKINSLEGEVKRHKDTCRQQIYNLAHQVNNINHSLNSIIEEMNNE